MGYVLRVKNVTGCIISCKHVCGVGLQSSPASLPGSSEYLLVKVPLTDILASEVSVLS